MTERITDAQLDREIAAFLEWESDNVAGAPSASELAVRLRAHARPGSRLPLFGTAQLRLDVLLLAAVLALLLAMAAFVGGSPPDLPTPLRNGWIAVSTQPGYKQAAVTDWAAGGDIYLAREGAAASLVVLEVSDEGAATGLRRFAVPGLSSVAPCPRWSRNGTHLAYLDGVRWDEEARLVNPGTGVVIIGLDGVAAGWTEEDPSADDLRHSGTFDPLASPDGSDLLRSPDGELRATCRDEIGLVVGPADGSADRPMKRDCGYSLAAWSPDAGRILMLSDGGRRVGMTLASVTGQGTAVLGSIPINGARSFPGRGDTSWQPVLP